MELKQIVEAMIFAAPDPISASEIAKAVRRGAEEAGGTAESEFANVKVSKINEVIDGLITEFALSDRATMLQDSPSGWRFVTRPEMADWIRAMLPEMRPEKLSPPALETLALIAYRQPITKADMEAVRGVNCDGMVSKLLERGLIESGGRADLPGRPMLYQTTPLFLDHFGVKDLENLPNASELRSIPLPQAEDAEEEGEDEGSEEEEKEEREPTEIELAEAKLEEEEKAAAGDKEETEESEEEALEESGEKSDGDGGENSEEE